MMETISSTWQYSSYNNLQHFRTDRLLDSQYNVNMVQIPLTHLLTRLISVSLYLLPPKSYSPHYSILVQLDIKPSSNLKFHHQSHTHIHRNKAIWELWCREEEQVEGNDIHIIITVRMFVYTHTQTHPFTHPGETP